MSHGHSTFTANGAACRVRFGPGVRAAGEETERLGAARAPVLGTPEQEEPPAGLAAGAAPIRSDAEDGGPAARGGGHG